MPDTHFDAVGNEICDQCGEELGNCTCDCHNCGDNIHECACGEND